MKRNLKLRKRGGDTRKKGRWKEKENGDKRKRKVGIERERWKWKEEVGKERRKWKEKSGKKKQKVTEERERWNKKRDRREYCQDLVNGVTGPTSSYTCGGCGQLSFFNDCLPDH